MKKATLKRLETLSADLESFIQTLPESDLVKKLNELQDLIDSDDNPIKKLRGLVEELELIHDEEKEVYYNKPDKWQRSDVGESCHETIEKLSEWSDNFSNLSNNFEDTVSLGLLLVSIDEDLSSLADLRGEIDNRIDDIQNGVI